MGQGPESASPQASSRPDDGSGPRAIGGSLAGLEDLLDRPVRVARGATSVVYRATHRRLGTQVAVKLLEERHASDPRLRERFEREARLLAGLRDDGIVRVLDRVTTCDGRPALVMEWLEGTDVEKRLRTHGPFASPVAAKIIRDVISALATAHRAGIVHRDVKPSNVMLTERHGHGRATLIDFGVASTGDEHDTGAGTTLGTPAFMAPEQAANAANARPSADVYAIGALFYTMVVGEPPHGRGDAWSQLHRMAEGYRASLVDAAPFIPRPIAELFDRCLSHDAARRPRDASALLEAFDAAAVRATHVAERSAHPGRALAAATVATLGAGGLGARLAGLDGDARSVVLAVFVVLALLAIAGFALRERARFTDAGFRGRLDRIFLEAAPRAAFGTTFALVVSAWIDARDLLPLDPVRVALAAGVVVFALGVRKGSRPELGQLGTIEAMPMSRSSASSLPTGSRGGRSTSSSPRVRGTKGSSRPS